MSYRTVILEGGKPWGLRLKGGSEFKTLISIEEVTSLKAKNAGLLKNDVVHSINGQSVKDCAHIVARNLIVNASSTLTLVVESGVSSEAPAKPQEKAQVTPSNAAKEPEEPKKGMGLSTLPSSASSVSSSTAKPNVAVIAEPQKPTTPATTPTQKSVSQVPEEETSAVKSPYMKRLLDNPEENHVLQGNTGVTKIEKAVTLDKPLVNTPHNNTPRSSVATTSNSGSRVSIGAPSNSGSRVSIGTPINSNSKVSVAAPSNSSSRISIGTPSNSSSKISIGAPSSSLNPHSSQVSAIPTGSMGGRIASPRQRDFIKERETQPNSSGSQIITSSGSFTCNKCKEAITEQTAVNAKGGYYHMHHFTCTDCNVSLTNSRILLNDKEDLVCQTCYENKYSKKCFICGKGLSGQYLSASDKHYHVDCFNCSTCKKNLQSCGFITSGDRVLCQGCHNEESGTKCSQCGEFIVPGESYVNIKDSSLHSKCFVCKTCGVVLSSFKERDGGFFCAEH